MKLSFHGAARTVTGTKHTDVRQRQKIFTCLRMFQGMGAETDALNNKFGFDAKEITCLFLSHAHRPFRLDF